MFRTRGAGDGRSEMSERNIPEMQNDTLPPELVAAIEDRVYKIPIPTSPRPR